MFGVPSIVADNFLKLATGGQIKVLLYLLRCSGKMCSTEDISSNTGVSPEEAEEAVLFWQQANVLSPQATGSAPAPVPSLLEQPVLSSSEAVPVQKKAEPAPDHKTNLSGQEIAAIMADSQDIRELFQIVESILGPLKHGQMNSIIWMYNHLGLKKEVISTLLTYCKEIDKANTAYIEKIATSWADNDINTLNAATNETQKMLASRDFVNRVARAFEMSCPPTTKQKEFIEQWRVAGFSMQLIRHAYEINIERINKLNFKYINTILTSWKDDGYKTIEDVEKGEGTKNKHSLNSEDYTNIEEYKSVINKFLY
jgi:DnaD/phage-associated family protein